LSFPLRVSVKLESGIATMAKDYIEKRGEGYYVIASRVSLDSIV
jgi:hypothetical protein